MDRPDWTFIAWSVWVLFNIGLFAFIRVEHPGARASQRKAKDFIFFDIAVFGSAIAINLALWYFFPCGKYSEALWETLRFNLVFFPYLGLWVVLMAFFTDISRASRRSVDYRLHSLVFLLLLGASIFVWCLF